MGFEELWNGFNVVAKRVEDGERFEKEFSRFVKKLQEIEDAYSNSLLKLVKSLDINIEIGSLNEAWIALKNEFEAIASAHSSLATKLESDIHAPHAEQMKELKKNRTTTLSKGRQLCKDLVQAEATMTKERKKYVKLRKMQDACQEELHRAQQQNSSSLPKVQKKLEDTIKKADKADTDYSNAVNNLKTMQDRFYDSEMPQILKDLENLEVQRMNKMRDLFTKLIRINETVGPERQNAIQKMKNKVEAVNTSNDLRQFVTQYKPTSKPPPRVQYAPYDKPIELEQYLYKPLNPSAKSVSGGSSSSVSSTPPATSGSSSKPTTGKSSNPLNLFKSLTKGKKDKEKEKEKEREKEKEKEKEREKEKEKEKEKVSSDKNEKKVQFNENAPKKEISISAPFKVEVNSDFRTPTSLSSSTSVSTSSSNPAPTTTTTYAPSTPPITSEEKSKVQTKANTELQQLRALYDYEAEEDNELSFKEGEIIYLIEKDDSGWWRGRNSKGQEGVFPSNFVEIIGQESKNVIVSPKKGETFKCRALYDYEAEDETELTIREGEILEIQSEEDGWYYGTNAQGKAGNFPSNYVEIIK